MPNKVKRINHDEVISAFMTGKVSISELAEQHNADHSSISAIITEHFKNRHRTLGHIDCRDPSTGCVQR